MCDDCATSSFLEFGLVSSQCYAIYEHPINFIVLFAVKLLDWGEDGFATEAETTALRTSFKQEVAVWHKLSHPNVTKVNISNHT